VTHFVLGHALRVPEHRGRFATRRPGECRTASPTACVEGAQRRQQDRTFRRERWEQRLEILCEKVAAFDPRTG
jgi:hypothetical protein